MRWTEALKRGQTPIVVLTSKQQMAVLTQAGSEVVRLDRQASIEEQRQIIAPLLSDADIVIASARRSGEQAPLLISTEMLQTMKPGCVVVDMALSEGGNVAGSRHDATLTLAGGVIVTNTSGYPKVLPHGASVAWSGATLQAIYALDQGDTIMDSCLVAAGD
ncbi:MAG: hypothetical protein GY821_15595 [Gammaproteobacteria bacterium]|nr:hypothetical protein [Gammaproteobacteria bacterium]